MNCDFKVEIVPFNFKYWTEFVEFINTHWRTNHPITNRGLFEWQYTGFGPAKGVNNSILLLINNRIEGFRGTIPGIYHFNQRILLGYSSAIWIINKNYRGKGLSKLMFEYTNNKFDVHCSLGVNVNTAGAIYKNKGYCGFDSLNRYVIPLKTSGYLKLINEEVSESEINILVRDLPLYKENKPTNIDAIILENIWENTIKKLNFFGLYRNAEFWNWRYINNVGFKYLLFGDPNIGVIITRVERVEYSKLKVLRILEILPSKLNIWQGRTDKEFINLLYGVLSWAKKNGCVAADFQISNHRLNSFLVNAGFILQDKNYMPAKASLAGLFQPFRRKPAPINGVYHIKEETGLKNPRTEDLYFVKSDNDMDRTNFWPIII